MISTRISNDQNTWCHQHAPQLHKNPVAYFSAEFGFHESLPISAGGLGILAGDHAKSASDLGLGFVGISLFYREGYFQQAIDTNNWQTEFYNPVDPQNVPLEPVLDAEGERAGVQRGDRHERRVLPGLARERRAACRFICSTPTAGKRTAFPRPDRCAFMAATAPRASCRKSCSASAACACCARWASSRPRST